MDCNTCTVKRPSNCSMCPENILNSDAMVYRMEQSERGITITNVDKPTYTEEEVRNLFIKRCRDHSTKHEKFAELLLEQDLKWFEENKK